MNTDFPPLFSWVLRCPAVVDYKWRGCAFSRWSTGRLLLHVTVLIQQSRLLFTGCSILLSFSTGGWDSASAVFSPKQQSGLCSTNLGVAAQGLTYQSVFCPWAFLNLNLQYGTITDFEKKNKHSVQWRCMYWLPCPSSTEMMVVVLLTSGSIVTHSLHDMLYNM